MIYQIAAVATCLALTHLQLSKVEKFIAGAKTDMVNWVMEPANKPSTNNKKSSWVGYWASLQAAFIRWHFWRVERFIAGGGMCTDNWGMVPYKKEIIQK